MRKTAFHAVAKRLVGEATLHAVTKRLVREIAFAVVSKRLMGETTSNKITERLMGKIDIDIVPIGLVVEIASLRQKTARSETPCH